MIIKYYAKQRSIFIAKYSNIKCSCISSSTNQIRYNNETENKNDSLYGISKKLWELNKKKKYASAISLFDQFYQGKPSSSIVNGIDINYNDVLSIPKSSIYAAMLAYSEVLQAWKLKELVEKLHDEKYSQISLCLLMHSYAKADKLGSAERLIHTWIKHTYTTTTTDTADPTNSLNTIKRAFHQKFSMDTIQSTDQQSTKNKDMKSFLDEFTIASNQNHQHDSNSSNEIPLGAWISLLSIYNKHRAWRQCMHILQHLHNLAQVLPEYYGIIKSPLSTTIVHQPTTVASEVGSASTMNHPLKFKRDVDIEKQLQKHLDELNYPTFTMTHKDILNTSSTLSISSNNNNNSFEELQYLRLLQWNIIYHLTYRALCETNQFELCLATMAQMKTYYIPSTNYNNTLHSYNTTDDKQLQQPSQELFKGIFLSPQIPTVISLLHGFTVSDPGKNYSLTTTDNILLNQNIVLSLKTKIVETFVILIKDKSTPETMRTANLLIREYLHALCKLGLIEAAEDFVTSIQAQLIKVQQQNNNIVMKGFQNNNWMYPLILYFKEQGEWQKLHKLYGESIEPLFDGNNKQGIPYLQNNHNNSNNNHHSNNSNNNRTKQNDMIKYRNKVKNSSPTINMYHQTCKGLRSAGQIEKLADLMEAYSPDVISNDVKNR